LVAGAAGVASRTVEHIKQRFIKKGKESELTRKPANKPRRKIKTANLLQHTRSEIDIICIVYISREVTMKTARLFQNGKSQAVRIPCEFKFEGDEVIIKRARHGGLLILPKAITYEHVKAVCEMQADAFERDQPVAQERD
jgi:antitoxin VapB